MQKEKFKKVNFPDEKSGNVLDWQKCILHYLLWSLSHEQNHLVLNFIWKTKEHNPWRIKDFYIEMSTLEDQGH